jgi:hypothetical protein
MRTLTRLRIAWCDAVKARAYIKLSPLVPFRIYEHFIYINVAPVVQISPTSILIVRELLGCGFLKREVVLSHHVPVRLRP